MTFKIPVALGASRNQLIQGERFNILTMKRYFIDDINTK